MRAPQADALGRTEMRRLDGAIAASCAVIVLLATGRRVIITARSAVIMTYLHELPGWPHFRWNDRELAEPLGVVRHRQGRLVGRMEGLGFSLRADATLRTLTDEVLKSSDIEGEVLDEEQVRSSLARRLGMKVAGLVPSGRDVEGVVEMMLDAVQRFSAPLTSARLFSWHASLFPTGWSGLSKIGVGAWRTDASGPMQVVSGPIGHTRVHYEAPGAERLEAEMRTFLDWFESGTVSVDPVIRAGLAHLWFVTIHPFDDGNGRIGRAISELALARSEQNAQRFYSMSSQIRAERGTYYDTLEATQKGDLDVTGWLRWFLACLDRAFGRAETTLGSVLQRARFWEAHSGDQLNDRQRLILSRLLDGFEGKLTSSKWAKLAKCSQDTALRDIDELLTRGILRKDAAGGRSTSYSLVLPRAKTAP
jgi:Fic family protein